MHVCLDVPPRSFQRTPLGHSNNSFPSLSSDGRHAPYLGKKTDTSARRTRRETRNGLQNKCLPRGLFTQPRTANFQDDTLGTSVVCLSDRAEPLLACCVPYLNFDIFTVQLYCVDLKVDTLTKNSLLAGPLFSIHLPMVEI